MKISSAYELGNFTWGEVGFCEHCGELPPFQITWCDGTTQWCLSCALCDDDSPVEITKTFAKEMVSKWKEDYKKYLKEKLDAIDREVEKTYNLLMEKLIK